MFQVPQKPRPMRMTDEGKTQLGTWPNAYLPARGMDGWMEGGTEKNTLSRSLFGAHKYISRHSGACFVASYILADTMSVSASELGRSSGWRCQVEVASR